MLKVQTCLMSHIGIVILKKSMCRGLNCMHGCSWSMSPIELSDQARRHALFPLLDFIVKSSHAQQKQMDSFSTKLIKVETDCSQIMEMQKELQRMIKNFGESTFDIKKSIYTRYICHTYSTQWLQINIFNICRVL